MVELLQAKCMVKEAAAAYLTAPALLMVNTLFSQYINRDNLIIIQLNANQNTLCWKIEHNIP